MLAPDDRAVLREQLRPDPGAELEIAVATTFTLDLTAALVVPLAFASHEITGTTDPVAVLEAVRSAADRVHVFCQAGQIRVPQTASSLMAFLEPMVHEVTAPLAGFLFHPKIWVARYRAADGERSYRLLCGTRNLTDDVSWDAMVRLDGTPFAGRPDTNNRPLVDLIKALPTLTVRRVPSERRDQIDELGEELRRVRWEHPEGVTDLAFHCVGLSRTRGPSTLETQLEGTRHLVVSPFLDDAGVDAAFAGTTSATLVSRAESMEQLAPATLEELDCWVVSSLAGLAQPDEDDDAATAAPAERNLLGGLHAKVYVVEQGKSSWVFIGSSNATSAGMRNGNVEFVVEMRGGRKALGIDTLMGAKAPFATILEPYSPTGGQLEPIEDTIGREMERCLRRLATGRFVAEVTPTDAGWTEHVRCDRELDLPPGTILRIGLLSLPGRAVEQAGAAIEASFDRVATADITPFVVLRLDHDGDGPPVARSSVVRASLMGDPPERFDEVIAAQVDTPEKFLRFLAILLGLGTGFLLPSEDGAPEGGKWALGRVGQVGLFELLVRAMADHPAALEDLDRLVERLQATERGRSVLPDGFSELWAQVNGARRRMARA